MPSQTELISEIIKAVESTIDKKMEKYGCPLNSSDRRSVPDLYSMVRDLGEGDLGKGVRKMRRFFVFIEGLYNKKTVATGAVFTMTVLALAGYFGTCMWSGIVDGLKTLFGIK